MQDQEQTPSVLLYEFFLASLHRMTPHLQLFCKNAQVLWAIYNIPLWFCLVSTLLSDYHQEQSQKLSKLCVSTSPIITKNHTHMKLSDKGSFPFREDWLVAYCLLSVLHQLQSLSDFLCSDQTELRVVWQATPSLSQNNALTVVFFPLPWIFSSVINDSKSSVA